MQYQSGGRPQIYSDQEAHTVRDVGHRIPWIYVVVDNKKADHQASIIEMECKLYDQVVYIFIDPGSNYSYINPELVDKCGLKKKCMQNLGWYSWLQVQRRQFTIG